MLMRVDSDHWCASRHLEVHGSRMLTRLSNVYWRGVRRRSDLQSISESSVVACGDMT